MSKKEVKTNVMRMLERQKIPYTYETYKCDEFTDGTQVSKIIIKSTCIFSTFMLSYMSMPHNEVKVLPISRSDTVIGE